MLAWNRCHASGRDNILCFDERWGGGCVCGPASATDPILLTVTSYCCRNLTKICNVEFFTIHLNNMFYNRPFPGKVPPIQPNKEWSRTPSVKRRVLIFWFILVLHIMLHLCAASLDKCAMLFMINCKLSLLEYQFVASHLDSRFVCRLTHPKRSFALSCRQRSRDKC